MRIKIVRSLWIFILWVVWLFFLWNTVNAKDYEYKSWNVSANVWIDGSIYMMENLTVNFLEERHGIIRIIPLNYSVLWDDFHVDISNIYVNWNKYTLNSNWWNIEIKIWDVNKTVIWEQVYPISYSVYWLIRNFSWMWYAELYWNIIGSDVDTTIDNVKAEILLPKVYTWFTDEDFLISADWKTNTVKEFDWNVDWSKWNRIIVTYNKWLSAFQAITLSIKFPNNYFEFDHDKQEKLIWQVWMKSRFEQYWYIAVIWIIWFYWLLRSLFKKREPKIKKSPIESSLTKESPIVVKYGPPAWISCAEAWMLYDCILEPRDLTSLLYKWAVEWLISIQLLEAPNLYNCGWGIFVGEDVDDYFIMTKLKNIDENSPSYEVDFFKSLFPWGINSKRTVSKTSEFDITWSLKSLRNYGKSKWWIWVWGIESHKSLIWIIAGIIIYFLIFMSWWALEMDIDSRTIIPFVPAIIVAIIVIFNDWSSYPTQKKITLTEEWKRIALDVLWYAKFIQVCDENKLRLFLKQDPAFFDKTLPYAVAFWFETLFIKKITPILKELDIKVSLCGWNIGEINSISRIFRDIARNQNLKNTQERKSHSTYDRSKWFSGWSSFSWGFSHGWWGGGWGSRSW